ncbi:MAG: cytidylate kinase, partial [Micavibrio aeruginosavorus]
MKKTNVIAIDGPSASGKGTLARRIAKTLGYAYLDTGALYRAVAHIVLQANQNPDDEEQALAAAAALSSDLHPEDLRNPALRTDTVGTAASKVAKFSNVRDRLLAFQKDFAQNPPQGCMGAVLDGRDIG